MFEQGFPFIFNSAIVTAMLWHDGLDLTNEGTNMLSNNFLQYLKNVPLGNDKRIFTNWQSNQGKVKSNYEGVEEVSPKDPEVPKLSNNTYSKTELSCIKTLKNSKWKYWQCDHKHSQHKPLFFQVWLCKTFYFWDLWYFNDNGHKTWWCISSFITYIESYSMPHRLDRNRNGGGVIIYTKEDIPSKFFKEHFLYFFEWHRRDICWNRLQEK